MQRDEVMGQLLKTIRREFDYEAAPEEKISNFLNSVSLIKLMVTVEKIYSFRFSDDEMNVAKYETLIDIADLILVKLTG